MPQHQVEYWPLTQDQRDIVELRDRPAGEPDRPMEQAETGDRPQRLHRQPRGAAAGRNGDQDSQAIPARNVSCMWMTPRR